MPMQPPNLPSPEELMAAIDGQKPPMGLPPGAGRMDNSASPPMMPLGEGGPAPVDGADPRVQAAMQSMQGAAAEAMPQDGPANAPQIPRYEDTETFRWAQGKPPMGGQMAEADPMDGGPPPGNFSQIAPGNGQRMGGAQSPGDPRRQMLARMLMMQSRGAR